MFENHIEEDVVVVVVFVRWQVQIKNNFKYKDKSNGTKGMEHSPGHIFSFFNIKGVMAAIGVDVEEGRGNRDAIEEMPRTQLNSCAGPAFCVGSRSVGHDLHIPLMCPVRILLMAEMIPWLGLSSERHHFFRSPPQS